MPFSLHIPILQTFYEISGNPENIIFPTFYDILNSGVVLGNPIPLKNFITPPQIWRPFEVTYSNFDIKTSKSEESPVKKKRRKNVVIPAHISVKIDEKSQKKYHCTVCKKSFKTKAHVKYHRFCSGGKKPFKCGHCEKRFVAKSHFEYHLRIHTGERPYACATCNKRFNQQGKLTRHMRIHTGEKPFICKCGRAFSSTEALKQHNLVHSTERPFACLQPGCGKRFKDIFNLRKHNNIHTGEKPFSCDQCSKSFGLKWSLELHKKTHGTDRPYACAVCQRAFLIKKDLIRHSIIHTDMRPYKCGFCDLAFRRNDNMVRHIRTVHSKMFENKIPNVAVQNEVLATAPNVESEGNIETFPLLARPNIENPSSLNEKVASEIEQGPQLTLPDVPNSDHDQRQDWDINPPATGAVAVAADQYTFDPKIGSYPEVIDLTSN